MQRALVSAIFGIALFPLISFAHLDFKKPEGFFSDSASLLSPKSGSAIESLLSSYTKETGNEIAVLIIPSLEGDPIEEVAVEVFQSWGIGQKGKDNGVLLLISKEDKEVRIEVGYGLEPDLTDAEVGAIIRNVLTPAFKEGKYDEGVGLSLEAIIKGIGGTLLSEEAPVSRRTDIFSKILSDYFFLVLFAFVWLASVLGRSKSWWLGGILGGALGAGVGFWTGVLMTGIFSFIGLGVLGLIFDFFVSKVYANSKNSGGVPPWWIGGGGFGGSGGFGGGGFSGFGGGSSGGGGASGRW